MISSLLFWCYIFCSFPLPFLAKRIECTLFSSSRTPGQCVNFLFDSSKAKTFSMLGPVWNGSGRICLPSSWTKQPRSSREIKKPQAYVTWWKVSRKLDNFTKCIRRRLAFRVQGEDAITAYASKTRANALFSLTRKIMLYFSEIKAILFIPPPKHDIRILKLGVNEAFL